MNKKNLKKNHLIEQINNLIHYSQEKNLSIEEIITFLSGKGLAVLLIICALPFCLPIQIPGLSTFFGILISFIGLRLSFGHRVWLPKKLLQKKIQSETIEKVGLSVIRIAKKFTPYFSTRWEFMLNYPFFHKMQGIVIAFLGLLLSLPLPIPLTNMFAATPIVLFGFGVLEEDGVIITLAYVMSCCCFAYFFLLFWFGTEFLKIIGL